jgi:hypothetical protein
MDRVLIGYDLRLSLESSDNVVQPSFDPQIWPSMREIDENLFSKVYGVNKISDVSNGLNLSVRVPHNSIPDEYLLVCFDAPREIVAYMASSFGLQGSLQEPDNTRFTLIGYDVVDLWTQSTSLFCGDELASRWRNRNDWNLIDKLVWAKEACRDADNEYPGDYPHQAVGIWIAENH